LTLFSLGVLLAVLPSFALDSTQRNDVTEEHNKYRRAVGVPELAYNASYENIPQNWANTCPDGHNTGRGALGENYYASSVSDPALLIDAVQSWHDDEVADYNCRDNTCSGVCGHLTQVLWSTTKTIACGMKNDCGGTYATKVICDYYPAGNDGSRPFALSLCDGYPYFSDNPYELELILNTTLAAFDRNTFITHLAAALGIAAERIYIIDDASLGTDQHQVHLFIITYKSNTAKQQGDNLISMVGANSAQLTANQIYAISARYSSGGADGGGASSLRSWLAFSV